MISLQNVSKNFDSQEIMRDVSYKFNNKGFYLLYGRSGCGKTTLLNMLYGTEIYNGAIVIDGKEYINQVECKEINRLMAYITQDCYFIDYLTVKENIELCTENSIMALEIARKFGISDKLQYYPDKLSGGERQRLAITQALAMDKKIILLDEPTAALDKKNKVKLFELIREISRDVLVICSSHDKEILNYVDYIIDYSLLKSNSIIYEQVNCVSDTINENENNETNVELSRSSSKERKLFYYIFKSERYNKKNIKTKMLFLFTIFISIVLSMLGDTPQNKARQGMQYLYKINQLNLIVQNDDIDLSYFENNNDVTEIVKDYSYNADSCGMFDYATSSSVVVEGVCSELFTSTLPYSREAFKLADCIEYGNYFTDIEQVILPYEVASTLGNPEEIIGTEVTMYFNETKYRMEVCGIFREFDEKEKIYLEASACEYERMIYGVCINNLFSEKLLENSISEYKSGKKYIIYYKDYENMYEDYKKYNTDENKNVIVKDFIAISYQFVNMFNWFCFIIYPIIIIVTIIVVAFYYQSKKIEYMYNKHNICIYEYYGYSIKKVKQSLIKTQLIMLTIEIALMYIIAYILTNIFNIINRELDIIGFELFSYDWRIMIIFIALLYLSSIIGVSKMISSIKQEGWFGILKKYRDLI